MPQQISGAARVERRILIRNARQLVSLQGPGGPRCGAAMNDIGVISNAALLIHDGIIEEAGPARRVENLAVAKGAREIDASGRIVMPAFVDPDGALSASWIEGKDDASILRITSKRNLEIRISAAATERARYGCLSIGAQTPPAADFRSVLRLLKTQRLVHQKPLRIRSIVSLPKATQGEFFDDPGSEFGTTWLPEFRRQKLASMIDIPVDEVEEEETSALRETAIAAASAGFAVRLRSAGHLPPSVLMMALTAGVTSIVAPIGGFHGFLRLLGSAGCVRVAPIDTGWSLSEKTTLIREGIDAGAAVALAWRRDTGRSMPVNPQFLLHVAVERYGLTPAEAITAVTWNAAAALRLTQVTGSLECGKSADLLIMNAADYRDLAGRPGSSDVSLVMRAGRAIFQRSSLILD